MHREQTKLVQLYNASPSLFRTQNTNERMERDVVSILRVQCDARAPLPGIQNGEPVSHVLDGFESEFQPAGDFTNFVTHVQFTRTRAMNIQSYPLSTHPLNVNSLLIQC